MRSRTRSGRISVFWWPTALWFVSGAQTVTSPIGSRASFSARRPRDSTPSSLVTRILGRVVQSWSGRAIRRRARGPPRVPPPESGSPRSLSRSRRSLRARSRVMSGRSPCSLERSCGRLASVTRTAASLAAIGETDPRRRARGRRDLVYVLVHAGLRLARAPDGAPFARRDPLGRPVRDRTGLARWGEKGEEERRDDGGDRDPEDGAGDPGDLRADDDRAEDDDRVDPDGIGHEARLEDV